MRILFKFNGEESCRFMHHRYNNQMSLCSTGHYSAIPLQALLVALSSNILIGEPRWIEVSTSSTGSKLAIDFSVAESKLHLVLLRYDPLFWWKWPRYDPPYICHTMQLVAFPREKGYGSSVPCLSLQHEGHRARCDQITILHLLMIIYKAVPSSYRHEKETNVESKHKPRVMWICYLVFKHFLRVIHHPLQNNIARTPL